MGVYRIVGCYVEPIDGVLLVGVHDPEVCAGRPCVIHAPSDHPLRSWPLRWRDDQGVFERLCRHGVGHPDPDSVAAEGVQSCDGCCGMSPPTRGAWTAIAGAVDGLGGDEGPTVMRDEGPAGSEAHSATQRLRSAADELDRYTAATPPLAAWLRAEADRPERGAWDDRVLALAVDLADEILGGEGP